MLKEIIVGTSILALGPFALSGCSHNPPKVAIQVKPAERVPLNLPSVDTINQKEVKWIIVTPENVDDVFHKLSKESVDVAASEILPGLTIPVPSVTLLAKTGSSVPDCVITFFPLILKSPILSYYV